MADTKEKKGFKPGVYAVFAGVIVAVVLVVLTIFAFTSRYTAFSPEKVAQAYTDTIVQTGDGYNAYKNTLVSKNQKFGNFVINAYMAPYVNEDAEKNEVLGTGTAEEAEMLNKVYDTMYDYYLGLLKTYGLDDYNSVFSKYFEKLAEVRKEIIGDDYMDTDFMFGVFESNVATYGDSLTGTEQELAADDKTVLQEATTGKYQELFGDDYKFVTKVTDTTELNDNELKTYIAEYKERATATEYSTDGLTQEAAESMDKAFANLDCSDAIDAVDECSVDVTLADGTVITTVRIYVVKIGNSWYVDNTNVDTSSLYFAL
jgi:hypothetical protein